MYYRHTGYPGGIKSTRFYELKKKHPERILEGAVKGMMPKNALNRRTLLRLKVYAGCNTSSRISTTSAIEYLIHGKTCNCTILRHWT